MPRELWVTNTNFGGRPAEAVVIVRKRILLRHHTHPCLPVHVHLYMGLYTYYKHFQDKYRSVVYCPTHLL